MAIKPKGNKVTGTAKKDNINFIPSKAWNKALIVNAGKGNDVINFKKSKYKNKLNGQDGNDIIYGGKNTDTINGGNGNDKLYGYAGNDIIYGGKGNDTIDGGDGNDKLYGQYGNNTIKGGKGNDTIIAGNGADKIYGGIGNDILHSGNGAGKTFIFAKGDGVDTIKKAKATDVIQINSVVGVTVAKNASNKLQITYGTDSIIIDNYNFSGGAGNIDVIRVKQANGTYAQLSIANELNGGANVTHIKGTDLSQTFNLAVGNNKVVFDDAPELGYANWLVSANTAENGYTDTIEIGGISFTDNTLLIYGANFGAGYVDDLWLDATAFPGCPGDGDVMYKDFYLPSAGNVIIKDKYRSYSAKGYNTVQSSLNLANDSTNRITAIKADTGTNNIVSNGNYNVINIFGGATLNYTYGGGHDNVTSLEFDSNDTYNVNLTAGTSVNICDWGGTDSLIVTGTDLSDLRLLFDISQNTYSSEWECNSGHTILLHKDNVSSSTLATATLCNPTLVNGINIQANMETVTVGGASVSIDTWCNQIKANVVGWLEARGYESVNEVFFGENPCTNSADLNTLIGYYNTSYVAP